MKKARDAMHPVERNYPATWEAVRATKQPRNSNPSESIGLCMASGHAFHIQNAGVPNESKALISLLQFIGEIGPYLRGFRSGQMQIKPIG